MVYSPEKVLLTDFVVVIIGRVRVFHGSGAATNSTKDQEVLGDKLELELCLNTRHIFLKN